MRNLALVFAILHAGAWAQAAGTERGPDSEDSAVESELIQGEESPELTPPPPENLPEPPPENVFAPEIERPSSSSGELIFDWSKYPDAKEVPHPFAEKGLIRITRDKLYIYKVPESEQRRAASFRVGMYDPVNLISPDTGYTFADNYEQSQNPSILFDYEWQLWHSPIGKWGLRAGTGFFVAQGNGHFVTENGKVPREVFTFVLLPVNGGAVYRLQIWRRQLFVPYAEGGATLFSFGEFRDDNKSPKFGGSAGAYFAGGVAFNLTYFDKFSRINLDREYGINAVYLTAEYRGIVALSKRFDFGANVVNAGFLMEY